MKIERFKAVVLTADAGMRLINRAEKTIGHVVRLGKEASAEPWEEITEAKAEQLQAQWDAEADAHYE